MSLEIRELVIKVNIETAAETPNVDLKEQMIELEERIIEKCLEKIQRRIEKSLER
ncbi:DUF5908 family protein [Pedobacter nyackensis]|uniref:DUF5908 family protein n=1 Tax=Pedobacter nyackensis TaxID=475255 RepID=UPI00293070E6|nr:DUF5908 family protein [Pedobacter nyackensis]